MLVLKLIQHQKGHLQVVTPYFMVSMRYGVPFVSILEKIDCFQGTGTVKREI